MRHSPLNGLSALCLAALFSTSWLSTSSLAADAYQIDVIANELDKPWSIAQLPDGTLLVTEKSGQLIHLSESGEQTTINGIPPVYFDRQGGLLEVLVDPDFDHNQTLYLSYAQGDANENRTTVIKAQLRDGALQNSETLLEVNPPKVKAAHYGGKLAFLPDDTLLVTVGDGYMYREDAQRLESEMGKLLRIDKRGTPGANNPFPEQAPRVYSYGHRNPQGLVVDPVSGTIYMTEHGPKGGDELNVIVPGTNYGWPAITYGIDYDGSIISPYTEAEGMAQPLRYWVPSIGTSGLAIYRGDDFPEWQGDLLLGALKDKKLYRLALEEGVIGEQSEPFPEISGRVRDVRVFDGAIYVVTDEGTLYKVHRPAVTH
jgi:glucose/arabinose dehydrogenase